MLLSTYIKYIFNSFLSSERLLNKKLFNIYLIEEDELDNYYCWARFATEMSADALKKSTHQLTHKMTG